MMSQYKELRNLTLEDLENCPIWVVEKVGSVEYVRSTDLHVYPTDDTDPNLDNEVLVYTKFTGCDGTVLYGYSFPWDSSGTDYTNPTIMTKNEHIALYREDKMRLQNEQLWEIFNKKDHELFPMMVETTVKGKDGSTYYEIIKK